jgi:hypothetical protein
MEHDVTKAVRKRKPRMSGYTQSPGKRGENHKPTPGKYLEHVRSITVQMFGFHIYEAR